MSRFYRLSKTGLRLIYKIRHHKGHNIHSPFVFHLINRVVEEKLPYYAYQEINDYLATFHDEKMILTKYNLLSFRMINYFNAKKILEIGSGKGINTISLTASASTIKCLSYESSAEDRAISKKLYQGWNRKIDLTSQLPQLDEVQDCIFISLENLENMPENIIEYISPLIGENSFVMVDGIRENKHHETIWKEIANMPTRTASLDLFHLGILFFDKRLYRWDYRISF